MGSCEQTVLGLNADPERREPARAWSDSRTLGAPDLLACAVPAPQLPVEGALPGRGPSVADPYPVTTLLARVGSGVSVAGDLRTQFVKHAGITASIAASRPGVRRLSQHPAQHSRRVGVAPGMVSCIDEVEGIHPVGNPLPGELTSGSVVDQPRRALVDGHASTDPHGVVGNDSIPVRRVRRWDCRYGASKKAFDSRDRRVLEVGLGSATTPHGVKITTAQAVAGIQSELSSRTANRPPTDTVQPRTHNNPQHNCGFPPHNGRMKPPPKQLPAANSKKWHARSLWDSLGYIRVRSLGNPKWRRDSRWLVQIMTAQRPSAPSAERALYDRAIAAARSYPRTSSGQESPEEA